MEGQNAPYRILFISTGKGHGGPTSFLFYLLRHLDRDRFTPSVAFYFHDTGPDIDKIRGLGVPVFFLNRKERPTAYSPLKEAAGRTRSRPLRAVNLALNLLLRMAATEIPTALKLRKLVGREGIEVVVLNNDVHYHVGSVIGATLAGIPCICRKAGGIGEGRLFKKYLTPFVSLFIAISRATEKDQRANNPGTRRLAFVYEGVNLELFDPRARGAGTGKALGISPSQKVVAGISRLERGKGHAELLAAAALVAEEHPDTVFLIVGDGEMMGELKAQAERLKLSGRVIFTGWQTDVAAVLSITDIFVHCPTTCLEGLGIANLEAMAMGKPTIVSENGGLPDAVVDGVTGFIVPPGDERAMARAISRLLKDERLAKRLGANARKRIEEYFDIKKNVSRLEELFAETAGRRPGGAGIAEKQEKRTDRKRT